MMKHLYRKLFLLGLISFSFILNINAQLAAEPVTVETTVLYGDYGEAGVDMSGYVMYEVFVNFTDPGNYLLTIFAAEPFYDCIQDDDSTAFFNFPCGLFQHEEETQYGFTNNCFYQFDIFPTTQFDSFVTIGKSCSSDPACDALNSAAGQCGTWVDVFE